MATNENEALALVTSGVTLQSQTQDVRIKCYIQMP